MSLKTKLGIGAFLLYALASNAGCRNSEDMGESGSSETDGGNSITSFFRSIINGNKKSDERALEYSVVAEPGDITCFTETANGKKSSIDISQLEYKTDGGFEFKYLIKVELDREYRCRPLLPERKFEKKGSKVYITNTHVSLDGANYLNDGSLSFMFRRKECYIMNLSINGVVTTLYVEAGESKCQLPANNNIDRVDVDNYNSDSENTSVINGTRYGDYGINPERIPRTPYDNIFTRLTGIFRCK